MNDLPAPACSVTPAVVGQTSVHDVSRRTGRQQGLQPDADERDRPARSAGIRAADGPVCRSYDDNGRRLPPDVEGLLRHGVAILEQATSRSFGGRRRPLLVSVRSGAAVSMPGMLDTILNIGLDDVTLPRAVARDRRPDVRLGLVSPLHPDLRRSRRRMPIRAVRCRDRGGTHPRGVPAVDELDVAALRTVVGRLQDVYRSLTGHPFPQDPMDQLSTRSIRCCASWYAPRAVDYRRLAGPRRPRRNRGDRPIHGVRQHGDELRARASASRGTRPRETTASMSTSCSTPREKTSWPVATRRVTPTRSSPRSPGLPTSSNRSASGSKPSSTTPRTSSSPSRTARCGCCRRGRQADTARRAANHL